MRDLLPDLDRWRRQGKRIALARIVDLQGSGPRPAGAAMAVTEDSLVAGSISGGCVEGALVQACLDVLAKGTPSMVSFGYSDDDAFAVGLTCGGTLQVFIQELVVGKGGGSLDAADATELYDVIAENLTVGRSMALATVIEGAGVGANLLLPQPLKGETVRTIGTLGDHELDRVVARDAAGELAFGTSRIRNYGLHGETLRQDVSVFIESFVMPARMLIFGAIDFAEALSRLAKMLGFRVTVCDAREMFVTRTRFPYSDEIVVEWPHRYLRRIGDELTPRDAICILTHEAKFDVPAITEALATKAGYIGAMGSRRTHDDRMRRLIDAGVNEDALQRLRSPIGLDLGRVP